MTLAQEVARRAYQAPRGAVHVAGRAVPSLEAVEVEHGYDQQTGSAVLSFRGAPPSWLDFRQKVEVWLGYGAYLRVVFTGDVQDVNRTFGPARYEVRAAGVLGATIYQGPDDRSWSDAVDRTVVGDLLARSGVAYDPDQIAGDDLHLGVVKAVAITEKDPSSDLIQRVDQAQGYATFDLPDGSVRRQLILTVPSATGALAFVEGMNDAAASPPTHYLLDVTNPATVRGIHTKVVVTGLPLADGTTPRAAFEGSSAYAPVHQVFETSSDLLETDDACATLAARLLADQNRVITQVTIRVAGNPYLVPGMTVTIRAPASGITDTTPFFVVHVRHALDASDGFVSEALLYGGASGTGYRTELRPVAAFTYQVTAETFDVSGASGDYVTVVCDASASSDPDTPFEALTFAWTSGGDPASGTGVRYSFRATPAALAAGVDATLTVSDGTSEDVLTKTITAAGAPVAQRELFVAAGAAFYASPDGGATWGRWPPTGVYTNPVRAVAPLLPQGVGYFGAQNQVARTSDFCATAPVVLHAFAADVRCVWVHESIGNRVLVGLDNGQVWLTTNLDQGTAATWVQLPHVFADPVLALAESFDRLGLIRVAAGDDVWISYDQLETASVLVSFAGTARAIALSFAGNYFAGSGSPYVQGESGDAFSWPGGTSPAVTDVRGLTTHIRDRVVYAGDRQGRSWIAAGGTAFAAGGVLGAGDPVNQLLRDGDYQDVLYAAADDGLYKSWDGALSWWRMLALAGASEAGWQVGYGGATLSVLTPFVVATSAADKATSPTIPSGWGEVDFDDAAYPAAVLQTSGQGYADQDYGPTPFVQAGAHRGCGLRRVFALPSGRVTGATLEVWAYNIADYAYVNGHATFFPPPPGAEGSDSTIERHYTASIPAAWLVPGGDNVVALAFSNGTATGPPPFNDYAMGARYVLTVNG